MELKSMNTASKISKKNEPVFTCTSFNTAPELIASSFWDFGDLARPHPNFIPTEENTPKLPRSTVLVTTKQKGEFTTHSLKLRSDFPNALEANNITFEVLTFPDALKATYSVKFDIFDKASWTCSSGESFGLLCENDPTTVNYLFSRLGLVEDYIVEIVAEHPLEQGSLLKIINEGHHTVRDIFRKYADIMHFPKKSFIRHLAEFCQLENDRQTLLFISSKLGSSTYMELARKHASFIDFLVTFKSCTPPLECILVHLPILQPRYYSCCNAEGSNQVEFIYSPIQYDMPNGLRRLGVSSNFLERSRLNGVETPFRVFPKASLFRLPEKVENHRLIMICAGTGISPFMGFLRTMNERGLKPLTNWLFYGFRNRACDFLFQKELDNYLESGLISKLITCISREPDSGHPRYVQDAIRLHAHEIMDLMFGTSSRLYICGDELTMISGVNDALCDILVDYQRIEVSEARQKLRLWNSENKIVRDIWI